MTTDARTSATPEEVTSDGERSVGAADRLARLLTEALAPAVLIVLVVLLSAWHGATTMSQALVSGLVGVASGSLIPIAYILWGVRQGRWTDHHVRVRDQRRLPLAMALVSGSVGTVVLGLTGARDVMAVGAAGMAALAIAIVITFGLRWKVSIHAVVAGGVAALLTIMLGWWLALAWPLALGVAWSRVRLRDHSVAQVAAGLAVGAIAASTVYPLLA